MSTFRKNNLLLKRLGNDGERFLKYAMDITRLLPHTVVKDWALVKPDEVQPGATWKSSDRRSLNVSFVIRFSGTGYAVRGSVERRAPSSGVGSLKKRTLDDREYDICNRLAQRASDILSSSDIRSAPRNLAAITQSFDGDVVAGHLQQHHDLKLDLSEVFRALQTIAAQTYENHALSFGCILDGNDTTSSLIQFPQDLFGRKKYKALTDGFRTSFLVSRNGSLVRFIDLQHERKNTSTSKSVGRGMFPDWAEDMASICHQKKCGICLTRNGDILVFDKGTLRFAYRFGQWRYLNHEHIIELLTQLARVQHVPPPLIGRVTRRLYRTALDVSFRRTGGLLIILGNRKNLKKIVRLGDAIDDRKRDAVDAELDNTLRDVAIQSLPRRVTSEIAGLDGAVVVSNKGKVLAYGAILLAITQKRHGELEGSRSKAAKTASRYGLAIKISSDGDATVYQNGQAILSVLQ